MVALLTALVAFALSPAIPQAAPQPAPAIPATYQAVLPSLGRARINARMGLNTWAAFAGTADDAVVAGDVAMLGKEVTPVLTAMRRAGLSIVSLHHHMIGTQPEIYFLHYWGQGPAVTLAADVKSAIVLLGK